jgi:enoyl-CoA hydratase/carnithine racemase
MSSSDNKSEVLVERQSLAIAIVRINRPQVRNALNMSCRRRLAAIFRGFVEDQELRCVVLTGDETSFAAGADIQEMHGIDTVEMYHRHTERLWGAIADCPVPVVAAVNGFALGGGMELAMLTDIIVAGKSAKFGQPEIRVGIMPGAGGTQRLTRIVGKHVAMRLCLTGELIDAAEAHTLGLVSKLVEDAEVFSAAMEIAEKISAMPPIAVAQVKEVIIQGQDASLSAALALERKAVQILFATRDKDEGMGAFLEKRKPQYKGD